LLHFEKQRLELEMGKIYQNINISIFLNKNKYVSICFLPDVSNMAFLLKFIFDVL